MKLSLLTTLSMVADVAWCRATIPDWHPPGPLDIRGPCPMLNAFANHGLLPRNGLNITLPNAISAMTTALNFDPALAEHLWNAGMVANTEPGADSFTMMHLRLHNIVEHDSSMSRQDAYFGNNFDFNQTVFDGTRAFWVNDTLDRFQLANGKLFRQLHSRAHNPTYFFTEKVEKFSLGEMGAPVVAFGDIDAVTVPKAWVEYWFEKERLPYELGWTPRAHKATLDELRGISAKIAESAKLIMKDPSSNSTPGLVVQGQPGSLNVQTEVLHAGHGY
ncbi:sterigmatocystin biosynthesis peroxidase-like protein 4 [Elsinoe australis]|uniref:Sterigmatocystin biosynthesis peroxidase-like protein 4 n=1 Tax=Elsinoe australis TaxID=40998 RepID=A0A4V6DTA5_9PEZI|nr:sterigmatocystin biosynthesis peroxidase-like protein 4 [Elsinoe australis]